VGLLGYKFQWHAFSPLFFSFELLWVDKPEKSLWMNYGSRLAVTHKQNCLLFSFLFFFCVLTAELPYLFFCRHLSKELKGKNEGNSDPGQS
jgi:hypothetical protein